MKPRPQKRHRQDETHDNSQPQDVIQTQIHQPQARLEHEKAPLQGAQAKKDGDEFMNTSQWS
jgi:hypothetical protein